MVKRNEVFSETEEITVNEALLYHYVLRKVNAIETEALAEKYCKQIYFFPSFFWAKVINRR